MTRRSSIKKELIDTLRLTDLPAVFTSLQEKDERDILNPLFSALCHPEEIVRWHAVSAFGWIVDRIAGKDLESARVVMRRFLWSLNDESGGIGWGAPEAMAEIMVQNETLLQEYLHMLLSYTRQDGPDQFQDGNFLELPQLQRGVIWGIGRLAGKYKKILTENGVNHDLLPYLHSPDGPVRGIAAWSLGILKARSAMEPMRQLLHDEQSVSLYRQGKIVETTVSELVHQALEGLSL
jgi:HEAT repeat protein